MSCHKGVYYLCLLFSFAFTFSFFSFIHTLALITTAAQCCHIEMCKCVCVCAHRHACVCLYTPTNPNSCQLIFSKATHTQHVQSRIKITPSLDLLLFGIRSQRRHHHPSLPSVHSLAHCWILSILTGLLNPPTCFHLHFICFIEYSWFTMLC